MKIGRTNNFVRREGEQYRNYPELEFVPEVPTDNYNQQRGFEQKLYDFYNPPLNRIRPISPNNGNIDTYMKDLPPITLPKY